MIRSTCFAGIVASVAIAGCATAPPPRVTLDSFLGPLESGLEASGEFQDFRARLRAWPMFDQPIFTPEDARCSLSAATRRAIGNITLSPSKRSEPLSQMQPG